MEHKFKDRVGFQSFPLFLYLQSPNFLLSVSWTPISVISLQHWIQFKKEDRRGGNAGLYLRVGQELWSAQLSSAPTYPLTQAKGTIPDLVFAVCTAGSSGSQVRRESFLLTILQTHRYIMASPSSKIKMNNLRAKLFRQYIFFLCPSRSQMWRHTGRQRVGGPVWLESSENTKLFTVGDLLLDTLLLVAHFLAVSEAA